VISARAPGDWHPDNQPLASATAVGPRQRPPPKRWAMKSGGTLSAYEQVAN